MDPKLATEVWRRLSAGQPLDGLGLGEHNGRLDLREINAPEPDVLRQYSTASTDVTEYGGYLAMRGVHLRRLDFSHAHLGCIRILDSTLENCLFERAGCQDWRMWGTRVVGGSFVGADLRRSSLGAVHNGARNAFRGVTFSEADLRQTSYVSCDFVACRFAKAKLEKVDFQGAVFSDCSFEGELSEVLFYRQAFRGEKFPPNEMKGVDLRAATLRHVEFRGLDMTDVRWPEGDEYIIVHDYVAALTRVLGVLRTRTDLASKKLVVVLEMKRKWAGAGQESGVLNRQDLVEAAGAAAVEDLLTLFGQTN
jgi:uncharacterized protein YjbI with pentapeptide repeats